MSNKKVLPDKCAVARDLMPLCIDGTASDASQRKVNKHVTDCPPCATVYQEMQTNIDLDVPDQQETQQFDTAVKKVKHKHAWRKLRNVLLGIVLALMVCAAGAYGYYWYFVEEVPLPVDMYEMELVLRSPHGDTTPVFIRTKNMPRDAKVHIEVVAEGATLDEDNQIQPNRVMYIWAATTRSVNLDTCGYTDYNYYAFDSVDQEDLFLIQNEIYSIATIYKGAVSESATLLYKTNMSDYRMKSTAVRNLVLHSVASLDVVGDEKVHASIVAPTPMPQQDSVYVMYDEIQTAQSTPVPQTTQTPMVTQVPNGE